ncbi:hypothetical protein [Salibacter halophilus]|uniref:Uncharacterized protein n=1 Tax=Salibacter halophilus TaxID=1803916 RepID=A0A6N6M373_9FLAO|nr:hypothetical protein [Salibacter halophilus]KAB1063536.1 hypothetical protein F3059_10745 [Salibacter halophilus]
MVNRFKNQKFFNDRPDRILNLANRLTPLLNELHSIDRSERFWLHLLSLYFKSCIGQQEYMSSKGFSPKVPLNIINSYVPITRKQIIFGYVGYVLKALQSKTKFKDVKRVLLKSNVIICGTRKEKIKAAIGGDFFENFIPLKVLIKPNISRRRKNRIIAESQKDIFIKNVLLCLPRFYVEYFDWFIKKIPILNSNQKEFHFEHTGGVFDEYLLAQYQSKGSRVVAYQTGGYMGELKDHPDKTLYEVIDELRTYGWKYHRKDFPFRALRLEEYMNNYSSVDVQNPNIDLLIVFSKIDQRKIDYYNSIIDNIENNIDREKFREITCRMRPTSLSKVGFNSTQKLVIPKSFNVDYGRDPMFKVSANAELVLITDWPSTNFLESLKVGKPVLIITDFFRQPAPQVLEYISFFKQEKVIHESVTSLIEFINNVDIATWQKEVQSKSKFKEFKKLYLGE